MDENASKALKIAGEVLIGVLILSLIVVFYNNLSNYEKVKQEQEELKQSVSSNSDYEVFLKDIYGSQLFSLVNKINDNNKRKTEDKNFTKVTLQVKFKKDYKVRIGVTDYYIFKENNTYSETQMKTKINEIEQKYKNIDDTLRRILFKFESVGYDSNGRVNSIRYSEL